MHLLQNLRRRQHANVDRKDVRAFVGLCKGCVLPFHSCQLAAAGLEFLWVPMLFPACPLEA